MLQGISRAEITDLIVNILKVRKISLQKFHGSHSMSNDPNFQEFSQVTPSELAHFWIFGSYQ